MEILGLVSVLGIIVGIILFCYGVSEWEEWASVLGFIAVILGVIGLVAFFVSGNEDSDNSDNHVRMSYQEICEDYGGEYLVLDDEATCMVEE